MNAKWNDAPFTQLEGAELVQAFRDAGKDEWQAMKAEVKAQMNLDEARSGRTTGSDYRPLPGVATLKRLVGTGMTSEAIAVELGISVTRLRTALTRARLRTRIHAKDREACARLRRAGYAPPQIGMRVGLLPAQVNRILAEATTPA